MIVYYKLANILKERKMQWKDLCEAGISGNTPTETYYADPYTNTLYNSAGREMVHGFLRIVAFMLFKNIIAVENANGELVYYSRKLKSS